MAVFIISLLSASLIMSVITLLLLVFFKKMPQLLSAKTRYIVWILVLLAFVIPIRPSFGTGLIQLTSPTMTEVTEMVTSKPIVQMLTLSSGPVEVMATNSIISHQMGRDMIIASFVVWSIGAMITFIRYLWQYYRFRKMVLRWGDDESDCNVLNMLATVLSNYGVASHRISIKRCALIKSPMLIGFIRPIILLPTTVMEDQAMNMVLEHEVIHYVHKDIWINLLGMIAMCTHWFNPLVKLCCRAMQEEGEAFCDATLLANRSLTYRRYYGEMIIQSLSRGVSEPIALSTCFYGKKFNFKKRILSIMDTSKKLKRFSFIVVISVVSIIMMSGSVIVLGQPSVQEVAQQEAVHIIEDIPMNTAVAKEVDDLSIPTDKEVQEISATIQSYRKATNNASSSQNTVASHQSATTSSVSNNTTSIVATATINTPVTTNNAIAIHSPISYPVVMTDADTDEIDDIEEWDDNDDDEDMDDDED